MTSLLQYGIDALSLGSIFALFALGIAFIFGIVRLVNFAHGEFVIASGYLIVLLAGWPWPVVVLVALAGVVLLALIAERLVFRPARTADPATVLVIAFSLSVFLQNLLLAVAGPRAKSVGFGVELTRPVAIGSLRIPAINLVAIGVTILLLIAIAATLRTTALGRQLRAAAEDFAMARLLGVKANRVIAVAFAVSGGLAATAGILLTVQSGTATPDGGLQPLLIGFIATVIGGMGSLVGAVVGGYTVGVLTVILQSALPSGLSPYRDAFVLALVITMLVVRPQGLVPAASQQVRV